MAITTLSGLASGVLPAYQFNKNNSSGHDTVGVWHSTYYNGGLPAASAAPSPGIDGEALTTATQIPFSNPASGNTYLARFECTASTGGTMMLADRLWQNSGITINDASAQAITPVAIPARDRNGTTNGEGVLAMLEVSATAGNGTVTNTTITYTNSAGTGSRTGTIYSTSSGGLLQGTCLFFELQAGDKGVRSVESLTLGTTYVSGTIHLVLIRPIASVVQPFAGERATIRSGLGVGTRLYDNSVPFLMWCGQSSAATNYYGLVQFAQG